MAVCDVAELDHMGLVINITTGSVNADHAAKGVA